MLTWLHLERRDMLQVQPRWDREVPLTGLFATRPPSRPNPVGLHRVSVSAVGEHRLRVATLKAIDGTPVVDIKPVRESTNERCRAERKMPKANHFYKPDARRNSNC